MKPVLQRQIPFPDNFAAFLIVLAGSIACFVPWHPYFPANQLDVSWQYALNEAVARQMRFGKDTVFTFGPYLSICWPQYHPKTFSLMMFGSAYLALAFSAGIAVLARSYQVLAALLVALLLSLNLNRDAFLFALPIAMIFVFAERFGSKHTSADFQQTQSVAARWGHRAALALLVSAVALLPLAKGTLALSSMALIVVAALLAGAHNRLYGLAVLLGYVASMCIFWMLAGQQLIDLPGYLLSLRYVVSGYTDAMSVYGPPKMMIGYVLLSILYLYLFGLHLRRAHRPVFQVVLLLVLAAVLFLVFKSAFVRHDQHQWIAVDFAILAVALFVVLAAGRVRVAVMAVGLVVLLFTGKAGNLLELPFRVVDTFRYHWHAGRNIILNPVWLDDRFNAGLQRIREDNPLPAVAGPVDIYSYDQAVLLAHGMDWSPRPFLQSYTVYTPEAARIDADHLRGPGAPQTLFFRLQTIDNRFPALDDASSWPLLLGYYAPTALDGKYIRFQRRSEPLLPLFDPLLAGAKYRLGKEVDLPASASGLLWAELDIQPTLVGRLVSLVFKLPQLHIAVRSGEGAAVDYRYIASMGRSGFLLSPVIGDTQEFFALARKMETGESGIGRGAQSIKVYGDAGSDWLWRADYALKLSELRIPIDKQYPSATE